MRMPMSKTRNIDAIELALATYYYASTSHYNDDLMELRKAGGQIPDLGKKETVAHLLRWLRKWKCRNFELQHEAVSTKSVMDWYAADKGILRSVPNNLLEMSEHSIVRAATVFDKLANLKATPRKRVGPTAASKILYVIKPYSLPPWDEPIRVKLGHRGDAESYANYLRDCKRIGRNVSRQCTEAGVKLESLISHGRFRVVGIAKALDEFYWTTITNKVKLPDIEELRIWSRLADSSRSQPI
jgi:hypothetical protein